MAVLPQLRREEHSLPKFMSFKFWTPCSYHVLIRPIQYRDKWTAVRGNQGAGRMALETQGSKEQNVIWEQRAQKFGKGSREQQKMGNGARNKRNYKGAIWGKIKKEQGAKRDEKGAVKIDKKEWAPKNEREQEEWGKMSKGAGSIDPLTEPHKLSHR